MKNPANMSKHKYVAAITEAFKSNCINPCVRYSHRKGFRVESAIHPRDEDDIWQAPANYYPSGRRSLLPCDYKDVRRCILCL